MDLNHRSPGYEPDGISRLPHLVMQTAGLTHFQTTDDEIVKSTPKLFQKRTLLELPYLPMPLIIHHARYCWTVAHPVIVALFSNVSRLYGRRAV